MKTYTGVLKETVNYYATNPLQRRAVVRDEVRNSSCQYLTGDGRMCAIGRVLDKRRPEYKQIKNIEGDAWSIFNDFGGPEVLLKPSYHHLTNEDFWDDLQNLHDTDNYWTPTGLSYDGLRNYQKLLVKCENLDHNELGDK